MWKTTIHAQGVDVDDGLRAHIDQRMRHALGDLVRRVHLVHVRLYGEIGGALHTCYIRVEGLSRGGVGRGSSAVDPGSAVSRAAARIGAFVAREAGKGRDAALKTTGYKLAVRAES